MTTLMLQMITNIKPKIEYGWKGYFITIVTKDRQNYFGEIHDNNMYYSHPGIIAGILWNDLANCRENVKRKDFVIMPNHLHGIIFLNDQRKENESNFAKHDKMINSLISSYKSAVTKYCNIYHLEFNWQTGFHNQYIKSNTEYENKIDYIKNNISNWLE